MSQYEPLRRHLSRLTTAHLPMTFAEIERILGRQLPASSRKHRAWWSNNPTNNVMTQTWLDAGYETADVDMAGERLVFRRKRSTLPPAPPAEPAAPPPGAAGGPGGPPAKRRHPLFGLLKGVFTLAPGTDLTQPADPDWGKELFGG